MSNNINGGTVKPTRLYYLDWLRVIAIGCVFLFHSSRFFSFYDWHINNATRSLAATVFEDAFVLWMMPLFFFLSGAAVYCSMKSRTAGAFLKERVVRILVPWLGIGVFVMAPFQVYLERLTHGQFTGGFFQFLPHYFDGVYGFGGNFAFMVLHLWYLMDVFVFSLIALPLFIPRKNGESILSALGKKLDTPWVFLWLLAALGAANFLSDAAGLGSTRQMGGWDILSYLVLFLSGYLLFAGKRLHVILAKYAFTSLAIALVLSAAHLTFAFVPAFSAAYEEFPFSLEGFCAWVWIAAFLGLGYRYLNFHNRLLGHAGEAVLPFYILHQPFILAVGFFVIPLALPIGVKYLIIAVSAFTVIMLTYEFVVRRFNPVRALLGMKLKNRPKEEALAPTAKMV